MRRPVRGSRFGARLAFAALAVLCLWAARAVAAEPAAAPEQRVKAAFLYKFGAYVEWPQEAFARNNSPVVIGVAGDEALARALAQAVAGRSLNGRPIQVLDLRPGAAPPAQLHILFVARGAPRGDADPLTRVRDRPVLTVTESDDPPPDSVINFVVVEDHLRFEISLAAAAHRHLVLGSALLAVARRVYGRQP